MKKTKVTLVQFFRAVLQDPQLASQMLSDPGAALDSQHIKPTPEKIQALQTVIDAVLTASYVFDGTMATKNI